MTQTPNQTTRDILLYDFLYILFKRQTLAIVVFFVVLIGFLFGTYLTTPLYEGTTKVWIHRNPQQSIRFFGDLEIPQLPLAIISPAQNIVQVATSQEIAGKLVTEFKLPQILKDRHDNPKGFRDLFLHYFKALAKLPIRAIRWPLIRFGIVEVRERNYFADAVDEFQNNMEDIHSEGAETEVVSLSVWFDDPKIAMDMSRRLAELTVEKIQGLYTSDAAQALEFVKKEIVPAEAKLREAETAVSEYKVSTGVLAMDEEKRIKLMSFSKISTERTEILSNLKLFESRLDYVEKRLGEQEKRFVSLDVHRDLFRKRLDYRQTLDSMRAKLGVLDEELVKQRSELSYLNEVDYELEKLQRDVDVRKAIYNNLRSKMEELEIQKVRQSPELDLKMIDSAAIPEGSDADWPDWVVNAIIGFVLAASLGLGLPFLFEYWDESLKDSREVEDRLGLPVFASIPEYHNRIL